MIEFLLLQPQLKGVNFEPQTTQTARKTLNPIWNEQLKCDVADDCLLQDEPLQLRVFDKDIFSADDLIGTVYVHCNSLYEGLGKGSFRTDRKAGYRDEHRRRQIDGWFPIYDTMRGICGELKVAVYIQHIMDFNPGAAGTSRGYWCSKLSRMRETSIRITFPTLTRQTPPNLPRQARPARELLA